MILEQIDTLLGQQIYDHAAECAPRECCGLLVRMHGELHYAPASNLATGPAGLDRFELDPLTWADAEDAGEIVAVVHSHPNASANPSMADRVQCERSGLPWVVVGWPSGAMKELQPEGWQAPLVGREFSFGVLDCYTLVQDFYRRELGIELEDAERVDDFWQRGEHLYRDGFVQRGGVAVPAPPRPGDVLLMRVLSSDVENHAAVYLGSGLMLHHLYGQLSRLEVYDWAWERRTFTILRHQRFLEASPQLRASLVEELR